MFTKGIALTGDATFCKASGGIDMTALGMPWWMFWKDGPQKFSIKHVIVPAAD